MMLTKQGRPLVPFHGFTSTDDMVSFLTIVEMMKDQYAGWLSQSALCEANSHAALSERDFDKWHDLFLEAEIEATNYWNVLGGMGVLESEN